MPLASSVHRCEHKPIHTIHGQVNWPSCRDVPWVWMCQGSPDCGDKAETGHQSMRLSLCKSPEQTNLPYHSLARNAESKKHETFAF